MLKFNLHPEYSSVTWPGSHMNNDWPVVVCTCEIMHILATYMSDMVWVSFLLLDQSGVRINDQDP